MSGKKNKKTTQTWNFTNAGLYGGAENSQVHTQFHRNLGNKGRESSGLQPVGRNVQLGAGGDQVHTASQNDGLKGTALILSRSGSLRLKETHNFVTFKINDEWKR